MKELFEPNSIAIIGASNDTSKWGGSILRHILVSGYKGKIYPISKNKIGQYPLYKSILDVNDTIDCAIIAIPINIFNSVLEECGKKGVKYIIAITAGFKEVGNIEDELKVVEICKKYNMRMLGPNMLGIYAKNFNASFMNIPPEGNISFIAQSGTMCIAIVEYAIQMNFGLNKVISLGNQSDIDIVDLLKYLNEDESTKVIVMYIEGLKRGKEFIDVCKKIKKPIIVLKAGRSIKGSKAAFSHTGSMAGSDATYTMAFKQAGVLQINTIDEIFEIASIFSTLKELPHGVRTGIITNGGGAGIIVADNCEKLGIDIPNIDEETKIEIRKHIQKFATASNPVDTAAESTYEVYYGSIEPMLKDKNIDSLICIYVHSTIANPFLSAQALIDASKNTNKIIIACYFGGSGMEGAIKLLKDNNIPVYTKLESAVNALSYLIKQKVFIERKSLD